MTRLPISALLATGFSCFAAESLANDASRDTAPSWSLSLGYTSDFWRNLDGGLESGARSIGMAEFVVDWTGEGGSTRPCALHRQRWQEL